MPVPAAPRLQWCWAELVELALEDDRCTNPIELLLHDAEQRGPTPDLMSELMQLKALRRFLRGCNMDQAERASQILVQMLCTGRQDPSSQTGPVQAAALLQSKLLGDLTDLLDGQAKGRVVFSTSVITLLYFVVNLHHPFEQTLRADVHARLLTRSMARANQLLPFKSVPAIVQLDVALVTQLMMTTRTTVAVLAHAIAPHPARDAAQVMNAVRKSFSSEGMEAEMIRLLHGVGLALKGGAGSAHYCCCKGMMERKLVRMLRDVSECIPFLLGMVFVDPVDRGATIRKELLSVEMYGCDVLELMQPAVAALVDVVYRKKGSQPGHLPKLSKDERQGFEQSLRSTSVAAHLALITLLQLMLESICLRKDALQTRPPKPMQLTADMFNWTTWAFELGTQMQKYGYEPLLRRLVAEEAPLKGQQADYLRKAGRVLLELISTVGPLGWTVEGGVSETRTPALEAAIMKVVAIMSGAELLGLMHAMHAMQESNKQLEDTLDEPVPEIGHCWYGCYHGNDERCLPFGWLRRRTQQGVQNSPGASQTSTQVQPAPAPQHEVDSGRQGQTRIDTVQTPGPASPPAGPSRAAATGAKSSKQRQNATAPQQQQQPAAAAGSSAAQPQEAPPQVPPARAIEDAVQQSLSNAGTPSLGIYPADLETVLEAFMRAGGGGSFASIMDRVEAAGGELETEDGTTLMFCGGTLGSKERGQMARMIEQAVMSKKAAQTNGGPPQEQAAAATGGGREQAGQVQPATQRRGTGKATSSTHEVTAAAAGGKKGKGRPGDVVPKEPPQQQHRTGAAQEEAPTTSRQAGAARHGPVCFTCGTPPEPGHRLKRCAGCMTALYCNVRCQKAHWKAGHRESCGKDVQEEPGSRAEPPAAATSAVVATAGGRTGTAPGSAVPVTVAKQGPAAAAEGKPAKPAAGGTATAAASTSSVTGTKQGPAAAAEGEAAKPAPSSTAAVGMKTDSAGGSAEAVGTTSEPAVNKTAASSTRGAGKAKGGPRKQGSTQPTPMVF